MALDRAYAVGGGGGGGGGGAVDSVNGQTGVVVLDTGDVAADGTNLYMTSAEKTKLTGIAAGATANSTDAVLLARANHTGTQPASTITGLTPTSVGLGNVNNTSDANKPVSTAQQTALNLKQNILSEGAFVNGDKTKLNGIATGATANSTDAVLLARANHTGTQSISTVTDLQTTLDAKANTNPTGITGATAVTNIVLISQANYDAIVTKSATTLYIINA